MRAVRAESTISVSPERVIRAFLDHADLQGWWRVGQSLVEARPGGLYALGWGVSPQGYEYVSTGIIAQLEPARVLLIDHFTYFNPEHGIYGPMSLTVEALSLRANVSQATVIQDGYQDGERWNWFYNAVVEGWPIALEYLREYLEEDALSHDKDRNR